MAIQRIDFRQSPLPDMNRGQQLGRGFVHFLKYQGQVNLVVGDDLELYLAVPPEEHWYVLNWYCDDFTSDIGAPNGWDALLMYAALPAYRSPPHTPTDSPVFPWNVSQTGAVVGGAWTIIWNRFINETDPVYWDQFVDTGIQLVGVNRVNALDPDFAQPRWWRSLEVAVVSRNALKTSGNLKDFGLNIEVVRFPIAEDDFNRLSLLGDNFLERDAHDAAHKPLLAQ